ncbi:MAG: hypothetical protein ACQEVA_00615 [Myxococcota bacterium]
MKSPTWKMMSVALMTAALVFATDSTAHADNVYGGSTADPVSNETTRMLSLSISGPHLIVGPIFELQLEFDASDKLSIAALGGWGQTVSEPEDGTRVKLDVWNAGGQVRYLADGNFDKNLHLGLEAMYTDVQQGPGDDELGILIHRRGVSVGPFVGGKYVTEVGLTAEAQVGLAYEGMIAESNAGTEPSARFVPIANVNIGWSF